MSYDRRRHRNAEASCGRAGWREQLYLSGRGGFAAWRTILRPRRPVDAAHRQAELSRSCRTRRATDRAAGLSHCGTLHGRNVFAERFHRRPAPGPAFGEARAGTPPGWIAQRSAAWRPSANGDRRRPCHEWLPISTAPNQGRCEAGRGDCWWRPIPGRAYHRVVKWRCAFAGARRKLSAIRLRY